MLIDFKDEQNIYFWFTDEAIEKAKDIINFEKTESRTKIFMDLNRRGTRMAKTS